MRDDIWNNNEREDLPEDDWYECYSCGYIGRNPMIVKEYGMEIILCENCGGDLGL